jgi:ADP-ribose pyrophosphatase
MDRWEVLARRELLDCSPWLKVFVETVRLEDGQTVIPDFYHIAIPPYVIVFALTTDRRVALIEQYKHAVGTRVLELPAGYIEPGEEPLIGAQRELLEETGLRAASWQALGAFTVDGNRGCGLAYAYLAQGAEQIAAPDPGDLERQTVRLVDLEQLRDMWLTGGFPTLAAMAVIGLGLALVEG